MSEKFVRHPRCRQMFLYASEQLKKSFAIAVIDEKLDFQQTDLGFKIGIPVQYFKMLYEFGSILLWGCRGNSPI